MKKIRVKKKKKKKVLIPEVLASNGSNGNKW